MVLWLARFSLLLTFIGTLSFAGLIQAQQGTTAATENNGQMAQQTGDDDDAAAGDTQDEAEEDAEEASDEASDEESPSRFIPTEQVSQDLGVSFPSDI